MLLKLRSDVLEMIAVDIRCLFRHSQHNLCICSVHIETLTGARRETFTCVGWQVGLTLCDPMWQVTSGSSVMGLVSLSATRTMNLFNTDPQADCLLELQAASGTKLSSTHTPRHPPLVGTL